MVERQGEGLTTEDLAGRRSDDEDDIRIEEDVRADSGSEGWNDRIEDTGGNREPIVAGPAQQTATTLNERDVPESGGPADVGTGGAHAVEPSAEVGLDRGGIEHKQDVGNQESPPGGGEDSGEVSGPLMADDSREAFVGRWKEIQYRFVEEPRGAVQQADGLVAEVMQKLAQMFADERARLESQWSRGDEVSTEDLRQAFRRYREFLDRLLHA